MAGGLAIDRRAAMAGVLGDLRGRVRLLQGGGGQAAGRSEVLVAAHGDPVPAGDRRHHGACATSRSAAVPLAAAPTRPSTISPLRFSISERPMNDSLASLPLPLRNNLGSGSVVEACVSLVRAPLAVE